MGKFLAFLKFNNAVPIAFTLIMLGSASAYAANNPEVLVERNEQIISIDNSYIADINLDTYSPIVKILKVEEDVTYYYVTYTLTTIELKEAVWQDVVFEKNMRVEKNGLGPYRDLGLYVTDQLNQVINAEKRRLVETQKIERTQRSQKKVAVAYTGLVGGFLSEKVESVKGYAPVVKLPKPEVEKQTFARPDPNALKQKRIPVVVEPQPEKAIEPVTEEVTEEVTPEEEDTEAQNSAPEVTLLGEAYIRIPLGATYTDLGATVIDDYDQGIALELYLNELLVDSIVIDTTQVATHTILYFAEDSQGLTAGAERIVVVYDPNESEAVEEEPEVPDSSATTTDEVPDEVQVDEEKPTEPLIPDLVLEPVDVGSEAQTQGADVESEESVPLQNESSVQNI